jgi:hypothetical protein
LEQACFLLFLPLPPAVFGQVCSFFEFCPFPFMNLLQLCPFSFMNLLQLIGKTPIVPLRRMTAAGAGELHAKLEAMNPGGSVKDRPALNMIETGEKSGELTHDKIVLEATPALAWLWSARPKATAAAFFSTADTEQHECRLPLASEICWKNFPCSSIIRPSGR